MRRVAVPLTLTPQGARPRAGRPVGLSGPTMGVSWRVLAQAPADVSEPDIAAAAQGAADLVVREMSTWEPDSDLSRFNRAAANAWVDLPDHLMTVVRAALELAALTEGAFDPTVGAAVDLWGFGPAGAVVRPPSPAALSGVRTGWRHLEVDGGRLRQPGGLRLDLSGIAKGYGVDLVAEAVAALGVRDMLVEIGGELRGAGVKGDGEPWWVEVEAPPDAPSGELPLLVALHGLSIATSGDWRREFTADGRRYSHTLDPRTRRPVGGEIAAVSVLHRQCMQADALCTALMVLGDDGPAFAEAQGLAAQFVMRGGGGLRELATPALQAMLA